MAIGANSYLNILDWLQGRVAGLQIRHFRTLRIPFLRNRPAAVFVDEMRVDPGFLDLLPIADIGMVKIMRTPYAPFRGAPGGAIAIYTKRGEGEEEYSGTGKQRPGLVAGLLLKPGIFVLFLYCAAESPTCAPSKEKPVPGSSAGR